MNYSNIRKQLGIDNVKQFDETMAYVTHYLQNLGYDAVNNYEELAINHVTGIDLNNIVYDIPFPPLQTHLSLLLIYLQELVV